MTSPGPAFRGQVAPAPPSTTGTGASNAELRATPLPVSGTVAISGTVPVSGPLTDSQLRASAISVTFTNASIGISGSVAVTGSFYQATQPVSIASMPSTPVTGTFWPATQPVSGTVAVSGSVAATGAFFQATQPVSIAAMPSTPVTGTFWQATQPVSIAATVNVAQSGTWNIGTVATITNPVTITPPTLTKGTQGATGLSVQNLKDAGRTQFSAVTVIGGVTCVTTEAMLSMVPVRAGVAGSAGTSIAVTAGKTLRLTAIVFSTRSSSAAVLSGRCALRMNPSGAAVASSPILAIASTTQQAAALAEAGDTCVVPLPDGIEISGTQQVGLSQVCSAITGVVYATLIGFEY